MCMLDGTCCSRIAENIFRQSTVEKYKKDILGEMTSGITSCRNHSIFGELSVNLIFGEFSHH